MTRVTLLPHPDHESEWILVELQGNLSVRKGHRFPENELGDLKFVGDKPVLRIGKYRLDGKCMKLNKPMVVLDRVKQTQDDKKTGKARVHIIGKIYEKYVFAKRPAFVLR
ncbi:hypothetical protein AAMO2058_000073600 [Amorphochlora amoebiformis]